MERIGECMGLVFLIIGFGFGLFVIEWLEEDNFGFGFGILFIALALAAVVGGFGCAGVKEEDCVYAVVESRQIVKNSDGYYREMRDEEKEADYYVVMVKDEKGKHECMLKKEDCYIADGEPKIEKSKCVGFKTFALSFAKFTAAGGSYWTIYVPEGEE